MSDMSAVEVIAGVLRQRQPYGLEPEWAEHVAAEVDKALGGLAREVSQATRMCSYPGSDGPCVGKHHGRWVGGWTPEEAS